MVTLTEALDKLFKPKGANPGPSKASSPNPYDIGRGVPIVGEAQRAAAEDRRLDDLARQHSANIKAQQDESNACREGTETLAQFEARTGKKYTRSPYGISPSTRFR